MKISFDLDDLLICGVKKFENEKSNFLTKLFGTEAIRLGTVDLLKRLKADNHQIFIYTTSLRSHFRIWLTFKLNGITLDGVINKIIHDRQNKNYKNPASKFPPMFNIDLHIDDSEGVKREGIAHNFKVVIINENDHNWTEKIMNAVAASANNR
jgi:hypothetical protein